MLVTAFEALGNAFEVLPSDAYYLAEFISATESKNALRAECTVKLRAVMGYAKIKWNANSAHIKKFGAGDMTNSSDKSFLMTCRMGVTVATGFLADLTPVGLTQPIIDNLGDTAQLLEDAMNDIAEAQATRDIMTDDRINKGNELYEFVSKYCEIGKIIWVDVNEAKYNDYVIYGPNGMLLALMAPYDFNYSNTTHKFTWSALSNATTYEIEISENHVDWAVLWTGTATEYTYVPGEGIAIEYRCRARNSAGYGPYCNPITIIYVDPLPPPNTLTVTADNTLPPQVFLDIEWSAVVGAEFYRLFESVVAFGGSEGIYASLGQFPGLTYRRTAILNRRYYYHVRAATSGTESADSITVYIDVPA
ncbi:MAG: hypothetical protein Q8M94_02030 [Ignavibacteria bacterium]|nr:hypothetical protein [Ignavibacteria bacterium]